MIHLQLATRNAHKTREFRLLLGAGFALEDLGAHPEIGEIAENGATFAENARIKAITVSRRVSGLVLADDSGLEVDSLGGRPGVFSARYAGEKASDAQNRRKLLATLAEPRLVRTARFRCVLVLARSGESIASFAGAVEGTIVRTERGEDGFGYDALFQPNGFEQTFAELSPAEKNALSHRGMAVAQLREFFAKAGRLPGLR